ALAAPDAAIAELAVIGDRELATIHALSQGTETPVEDQLIHELVGERARTAPDRVAVTDPAGSLRYAELVHRANQVANHLRSLGIGPDAFVGLILPSSAELAVAALGVLTAGAAYVPIDPQLPAERIAQLLRDSGVRAVLVGRNAGPL